MLGIESGNLDDGTLLALLRVVEGAMLVRRVGDDEMEEDENEWMLLVLLQRIVVVVVVEDGRRGFLVHGNSGTWSRGPSDGRFLLLLLRLKKGAVIVTDLKTRVLMGERRRGGDLLAVEPAAYFLAGWDHGSRGMGHWCLLRRCRVFVGLRRNGSFLGSVYWIQGSSV